MSPKDSGVPVVQGVAVASPYDHNNNNNNTYQDAEFNGSKGNKQPNRCKDWPFALLFYGQLGAMIACAVIYGPAGFEQYQVQNAGLSADAAGYFKLGGIVAAFAFIASGLMLSIMMCIPQFLIKTALIFEVALMALWAVWGFLYGNYVMGVVGIIFFAMMICYAFAVWKRIPFATANLGT